MTAAVTGARGATPDDQGPPEPNFRVLFEAVPVPVLVILPNPPHFTIAAVSDAYLQATMTIRDGPGGIVGRGLFEVFPDPPGDPSASGARNLCASLERVIETRARDTMAVQHYNIRRPDGTWEERHWSPVNIPVIDPVSGRLTHVIHRVEDVTDLLRLRRRESDKAAQAAGLERRTVELQAELVQRGKELQAANDRLRAAYESAMTALGRIAAPDGGTADACKVSRRETGSGVMTDRLSGVQGDGASELAVVSRALEHTTALLVQRTEEAERATARAEEANAVKARFLAAMSHDLRTPLNAIGGYTELITMGLHGPLTDGQRKALDAIRRSGHHLLGLITQVLSYAKLEAGRVQFEPAELPVCEVLRDVEALIAPQARAGELDLVVECPPEDGERALTVYADPNKLREILLNLVSNAVKFTAPGGVVAITSAPAQRGQVAMHVRDTGPGIESDQLERIFEPFVQAPTPAQSKGTGLGLAISRELARGMGGDVTVVSQRGAGSTFTLTLPAQPPRSEGQD